MNYFIECIGHFDSAGWDIASGQPRIFALAADHHFLDAEYDEYAGSQAHSAACFRSVALMVLILGILKATYRFFYFKKLKWV